MANDFRIARAVRAALRAATAIAAAAIASLGLGACSRAPEPPNILWISIDTLRADHLGCYGYARDTSPRMDALAAEGVVFEDAWSTSSWTLPAHLSMLTGLPVSAHCGCNEPQNLPQRTADHSLRGRFLAQDLVLAGYDTAGFYTFRYLDPTFGFGPGFETWKYVPRTYQTEPEIFAEFKALRAANDRAGMDALVARRPELFDVHRVWTGEVVDQGLAWIDGKRAAADAPFLLFLHLFDVHDPYLPPPPFDRRFDPDYAGEIDGQNLATVDSRMRPDMEARDLEHLIALYDGEIAAVDAQIGRLLDALAARDLAENTIVVITSDHGEEFFEHGAKLHANALYRESAHVPMILRFPRRWSANRRVTGAASLIDLVPTLRAACGLEADPRLPGLDLAQTFETGKIPDDREVLSELVKIRREHVFWTTSLVDARSHYLIENSKPVADGLPRVSRFDRVSDPLERGEPEPVAWDSEVGVRLAQRLDAWRGRLTELRVACAHDSLQISALDAEAEADIRALGYAGASADGPLGERPRALPLCMDGCLWGD